VALQAAVSPPLVALYQQQNMVWLASIKGMGIQYLSVQAATYPLHLAEFIKKKYYCIS